ncbi:MAG: hypothetical protein J1F42_14385 [Lachnospiraceae bacterium]|nr:hypothetical protein [Lachnospiraceae bacterium]
MRAQRIYTDLVSFLTITACEIKKTVNNHGAAYIKGVIGSQDDVLGKIQDVTWVTLYAENEWQEQKGIFAGIVESIQVYPENGSTVCELNLTGATRLMDMERKVKAYQNSSMTYQSMMTGLSTSYGAAFIGGDILQRPLGHFTVQYKETDWEFLLRMASNIGACVIPEYAMAEMRYYVGLPELKNTFICDTQEYTQTKEINCLRDYSGMLLQNTEIDDVVTFNHREILELGQAVDVGGSVYFVYKIESSLKNAELVHCYELRRENGFEVKKFFNLKIVGASLNAEILDVAKDKVKVCVKVDGKQNTAIAKWFTYSTVFSSPDGTGWYCMPEIGDHVRMYFPSENEEDAYIISSVHVDPGTGTARTNPDNKSIMNRYNKQIELTPTSITLTNGNGMSIILDDEKGITIESDKNISFVAKEDFEILSTNSNVEITAGEEVSLIQNDTSITLSKDITMNGRQLLVQQ